MDLRRLEIFAKVAELGSFSRASRGAFLTQPTVSEHVPRARDELGVQLLDRSGAAPSRRPPDGCCSTTPHACWPWDERRARRSTGTRGA